MGEKEKRLENLYVAIVGSSDFCRQTSAVFRNLNSNIPTCMGSYEDAWGLLLTHKPNVLILEIGFRHTERTHAWMRSFLHQVRERFGNELSIVVAITSSMKLLYGGDILFLEENSLEPSLYIDSFLITPPSHIPSIPRLSEQIESMTWLLSREWDRRANGGPPLPPLGSHGWVQSLADPVSCDLWMKWLPKYAGYVNENPLIIGQTGTGKTNLAYALHLLSGRKGDFISITPRDFSSSELVQAELFGAVAGAYTGAVDKWGLVKSAEKGTLFIDELQSIGKDLQGKLITFIENKSYRRVGSAETTQADVRFVFASNRTLYDMMEEDVLRDDFAYRLERVMLELAPLKERRLDISSALAFGLAKIHRQRNIQHPVQGFDSTAYRMVFSHTWPGNLRQLENFVAKLCEHADMEETNIINQRIVAEVFRSHMVGEPTSPAEVVSRAAYTVSKEALTDSIESLSDGVDRFSLATRRGALDASGGDIEKAAELIHDSPSLLKLTSQTILK